MDFFTNNILSWYLKHKRSLPWRKGNDPYSIWISEIMLQQTRIEAVIPYYNRFIEKVPDIQALATISDDELLKLWEGLGYYSRAYNLKKAAIMIENNFHGIFPNQYDDILSLPGIGEYTASAIGSICFSLKEVTIDGNVLRVYMRYFGKKDCVDEPKVRKHVRNELMKIVPDNSGDFNQGIMELGETVCLPNGNPKCELCPIKENCKTYLKQNFDEIPVKKKKEEKKIEHYTVLLLIYDNKIAISKRNETGILKNMYEFPNIPYGDKKTVINYLNEHKIFFKDIKKGLKYQHVFTHRIWDMDSYVIYLKEKTDQFNFYSLKQIENQLAIPTAFKPFLEYLKLTN